LGDEDLGGVGESLDGAFLMWWENRASRVFEHFDLYSKLETLDSSPLNSSSDQDNGHAKDSMLTIP
jgi:hypothetical protein